MEHIEGTDLASSFSRADLHSASLPATAHSSTSKMMPTGAHDEENGILSKKRDRKKKVRLKKKESKKEKRDKKKKSKKKSKVATLAKFLQNKLAERVQGPTSIMLQIQL